MKSKRCNTKSIDIVSLVMLTNVERRERERKRKQKSEDDLAKFYVKESLKSLKKSYTCLYHPFVISYGNFQNS